MILSLAMTLVAADVGRVGGRAAIGHRHRRQDRQGALLGQCQRPALSGIVDQDDDALLTFEALSKGKISKTTPVPVFGQCLRRAADQARRQAGRFGQRRDRDPVDGDQVGQQFGRPRSPRFSAAARNNFARMMTAKARALGMNGTVFRNANGLPDPGQFTTAQRHGHARHRAARALPPVLRLLLGSARFSSARSASTATTACWDASRASTASRPATPAPPASTSLVRSRTATAASSPWSSADRPAAAATTRWRS